MSDNEFESNSPLSEIISDMTNEEFEEYFRELIELDKSTPKTIILNPIKIKHFNMVYRKIQNLLLKNEAEFTITTYTNELTYKDIYIVVTTDIDFGIPASLFPDYQEIINNIDGISHIGLTNGKIESSFLIKNIYIEIEPYE